MEKNLHTIFNEAKKLNLDDVNFQKYLKDNGVMASKESLDLQMELISDFYSKQIANQLGETEAQSFAIENARIHLNKLIVIVSDLGRKDLAFEYNKILLELNNM